jgi:hypothetical protein
VGAITCPNCSTTLQPPEFAEGWCESCGKKIPVWVLREAGAQPAPSSETVAPSAADPSGPGPVPVKPLANPIYQSAWIGWGLALAFLALGGGVAGVGFVLNHWILILVGLLGGVFVALVLAVTTLLWVVSYAGTVANELTAMQRGACLAHWTYRPEEWQRFVEMEWARTRADVRLTFFLASAVLSLLLSVALCFPLGVGVLAILLGVGGGVAFAALICGLRLLVGWLRRRHNARTVGEAYLGPQSVYLNGAYRRWGSLMMMMQLTSVAWVDGDPDLLELSFSVGAGRSRGQQTFLVPIPEGRRLEARHVLNAWGCPDVGPQGP